MNTSKQRNNEMKKWTIAFVNYETTVYLKWQLKIYYEFNDPNEFEIIIVDNSKPFQKEKLEALIKPYNEEWRNIKIVYNDELERMRLVDSEQHGQGLTIALKMAHSKYFLAEDPDFFFVIKKHLAFLEKFLEKGYVAIGAPYTYGIGLGNPKFPALWGAAHPLKLIQHLDCKADLSDWARNECRTRFKDKWDYSFDVGYKIREALSTEDNDDNFISFEHSAVNNLAEKIGIHSYKVITQSYSYAGKIVAFHLFRGSFTGDPNKNQEMHPDLPKKTQTIRDKLGKYFYDYTRLGHAPFIIPRFRYFASYIFKKRKQGNRRTLTFFNFIKISYKKKKGSSDDKR